MCVKYEGGVIGKSLTMLIIRKKKWEIYKMYSIVLIFCEIRKYFCEKLLKREAQKGNIYRGISKKEYIVC